MVVLQTIVIIVGMFLLRAFSDLLVEDSLQEPRFSALVRGVRSGGLALLLIPAVWAAGTIYLERLESGWYRRRWSFAIRDCAVARSGVAIPVLCRSDPDPRLLASTLTKPTEQDTELKARD